jgi:hypothetical protein
VVIARVPQPHDDYLDEQYEHHSAPTNKIELFRNTMSNAARSKETQKQGTKSKYPHPRM